MVKSSQPRKVRKYQGTAPLHKAHKALAAHLAEELLLRYNLRSLPVRKGDTVKVMRGAFEGHINKVIGVDTKARKITVEGVTITKADKSQLPKPIDPSNVLITKLELSDPWRAKKLEKRKELAKMERKRKKKEKGAKPEKELERDTEEAKKLEKGSNENEQTP